MAKNENTTPKSFNQLEEEDFNSLLNKYKMPLFGLVGLIIAGVIGYGTYSKTQEKKHSQIANDIYEFRSIKAKDWFEPEVPIAKDSKAKQTEKKTTRTWEQVKASYDELVSKNGHGSSMTPLVLEIAEKLVEGKKKEAAFAVISDHYNNLKGGTSLAKHVLGDFYAGLCEDMGKTEDAVKVKEKLLSMNQKFMEAKTYFDLGRLYKKIGNVEKAKSNFEYLIKNFSKDEIIPLAKVYLSEL